MRSANGSSKPSPKRFSPTRTPAKSVEAPAESTKSAATKTAPPTGQDQKSGKDAAARLSDARSQWLNETYHTTVKRLDNADEKPKADDKKSPAKPVEAPAWIEV